MRSNIATEASIGTAVNQWWSSIPFVTASIFALCCGIYVVDLLFGYDSFSHVCLSPIKIASEWQVYRPWTAILFHAGILHIVFNMLAFVPMGSSLERQLGSVRYAYLLLLFAGTNGLFNTLAAYVAASSPIAAWPQLLHECGIGFSGVIFALIVVETYTSGVQHRSIFGFFTVPAKWYPWALLVLFQLLMPAVSLLGHLSGIVSGLAYCYGAFNILMPPSATWNAVESSSLLAPVVRRPNFIVGGGTMSAHVPLPTFIDSARSAFRGTRSGSTASAAASAWRSLQNLVGQTQGPHPAQGSGEADSRFPGQGRTLLRPGPSARPPSTETTGGPPLPSLGREMPAGAARGSAGSGGGEGKAGPAAGAGHLVGGKVAPHHSSPAAAAAAAAASRAGRAGPPHVPFQPPQPAHQSQQPEPQPPQAGPMRPVPAGRQSLAAAQPDGPLSQLVAMGFDEGAARAALAAANGDLTLAVELLGA